MTHRTSNRLTCDRCKGVRMFTRKQEERYRSQGWPRCCGAEMRIVNGEHVPTAIAKRAAQ